MTLAACPVLRCKAGRLADHAMCRYHWRLVPLQLRRQIWSAYRTSQLDKNRELIHQAVHAINVRELADIKARAAYL